MPGVEPNDVQRRRHERPSNGVYQPAEGGVPGDRADDGPADREGEAPQQRPHRRTGEQQGRGHHEQQHVLEHVDAEQLEGDGVDRRGQRCEKSGEPQNEEQGPPDRPPVSRAGAAEIHDGRKQREAGEDQRRTVVSTMIATNSSARYRSE